MVVEKRVVTHQVWIGLVIGSTVGCRKPDLERQRASPDFVLQLGQAGCGRHLARRVKLCVSHYYVSLVYHMLARA